MTVVDWAHVVLPLGTLALGIYLVCKHSPEFDAWIKKHLGS